MPSQARTGGEADEEDEELPEIDEDEFASDEEDEEEMKVGKHNALVLGPDGKVRREGRNSKDAGGGAT